ncbi:MAG TPA: TIGR03618 family F420-dependent PPOX class oxidoreductase [Ktedonobacteraceae bacterium]|nr:TIGR03618 family F420-dependent PPOX class oxidoreductase [Ktedonobacteraceae bacterium]
MNQDALQAFLAQPHDAIVSTNRTGKGSQLTPVWFVWDGESFLFGTQKASVKYANIVRDPNISLIVNDPITRAYVAAYGRAEIVRLERYPELWNATVEKYIPADKRQQFSAASWTQATQQASRVVIVLKPEKVVGRIWTVL